jgi:hypothetical protein
MGARGKRRAPRRRNVWTISGTIIAGLIMLAGLVFVGALILTVIMANSWGSNK